MSEQLLVAVFSKDIRDDVIDALIALQDISGFNMEAIDGYSREHSKYDLQEQVAGYRRLYRVEVLHGEEQESQLLTALGSVASASHIRYWIMPLKAVGRLP